MRVVDPRRLLWARVVACALLCVALPAAAGDAPRTSWHVDFVLDQSGSMVGPGSNDSKANALIAPLILADISDADDRVVIVPQSNPEKKQDVAPFRLDVAAREDFRRRVLAMRTEATGSEYQPALERAVQDVRTASEHRRRALILLYDGDRPEDSATNPAASLRDSLRASNVFSIVLGMNSGGESRLRRSALWRAFESRYVRSGDQLLAAFGYAFRQLINAKDDPPSGTAAAAEIVVPVPALSREAWLFVLADAAVTQIDVTAAPPGPVPSIDRPAHAAWTSDISKLRRGYRGIRLRSPQGGEWRFKAETTDSRIEWMLLPIYGLDMSIDSPVIAVRGGGTIPVSVTLGEDAPDGLKVTARVGTGAEAVLTCSGRTCTGNVEHGGEGPTQVSVRATTDNMDVNESRTIEVQRMDMNVDCSRFQDMLVPADSAFTFTHVQSGPPPDEVWAEFDGRRIDMSKAGTDSWEGKGSAGSAGKKAIAIRVRAAGEVHGCEAQLDVRPCLAPQVVLPAGPLEWGPCASDPNAACEACGGGCTGMDVAVSLAGTGGLPVRLGLTDGLPDGVTAWLGERELSVSGMVDLDASTASTTLRLCSSECPAVGLGRSLSLKVEVPAGLDCSSGAAQPVAKGSSSVPVSPRDAGFWACHRYKVYAAMAVAGFAFLVYGFFIRPLRFKRKGYGNVPAYKSSIPLAELRRLDGSAAQALKRRAIGGFWWSHQQAWLDGELSQTRTRASATVIIELVTEAPKGVTGVQVPASGAAWITSTRKLRRSRSPWRTGAARADYGKQWDVVPPSGELLQIGHVYVVDGADMRFAVVFTAN